jgi:hypothetical protein
MKGQMKLASLPFRFITPFPRRCSRRLRNCAHQICSLIFAFLYSGGIHAFSSSAQTSSPPETRRSREKRLRKAEPSMVAPATLHLSIAVFGICLSICPPVFSMPVQEAGQAQKTWDGNRTTPVHLIPLKDEFDQSIVPTESNPLPFSSRFSCEPCHDYGIIRNGLHFNAASTPNAGRPGEPWVWVEEKSGTLLPLSYRRWKDCWHPDQVGLIPWDFTLLFGRHLAGGGISEPPDWAVSPGSRWEVSGRVEVNCLGCHNGSNIQDPSEWAKQVLRQNFRWAATAAAGLGEVGGMASRLAPTWDIIDGPNPDDTEWAVPPYVRYDRKIFDSKHRAFLDILHKPEDSRCLACHSVGPAGSAKFKFEADVHSAAGLLCVSCHRNDIRHAMIRGYEGEAADNPEVAGEDFTCAGCHLGGSPSGSEKNPAGRLGAPYPRHKGFPSVHFKRLSCTVCHSGPWRPNREARAQPPALAGVLGQVQGRNRPSPAARTSSSGGRRYFDSREGGREHPDRLHPETRGRSNGNTRR